MKIKFIRIIGERLKSYSIRKKLLLSYFMLIFIPLIVITVVSYTSVSRGYKKQIVYSANQSFDQAYDFLSYKLNSLIKSSDIVYFNEGVQTILSKDKKIYENDLVQQNIDMLQLDDFLYNFKNSEDVLRVCLYVPGYFSYANQGLNFGNFTRLKKREEYKRLKASKDKVLWLPPGKIKNQDSTLKAIPAISLLRRIRNKDRIDEIIGVVKVSILESKVKAIINKASMTKKGVVYLQNSRGEIISSSNEKLLSKLHLRRDTANDFLEKDITWNTVEIKAGKFLINSAPVENTDWTMISAIPYSEILQQSNKIRDLMVGLVILIGVLAYFLAYLIANSTTKRISLLMKQMIRVQEGELDVSISSDTEDEVGQLMNSFNFMIKRVNSLVEEQYKIGKEIKNAELKALQAQINPHFLYNTLDLINWKAIDNDLPEIADISQSLARYYKLSLSKGKDIIPISDEIKHVETYVQIQNLRFDNRINLIMEIDEEIYKYSILKIILQPIVENSILHGILENRDKTEGTIVLGGRMEGKVIILSVEDDGMGMTEEKTFEILNTHKTAESHGYGVRNINNRIKLCYGQQYGLTYYSEPYEGTFVEIRIPALTEEEHHIKSQS